jgi:hypothetical protein
MRFNRLTTLAIAVSFLVGACGRDSSSNNADTQRTKNAALTGQTPVLQNGNFASNGGGWTGDEFTLGNGCNDARDKNLPSLGVFRPNALVFGQRFNLVKQEVIVPKPTTVTLTVRLQFQRSDLFASFSMSLDPEYSFPADSDVFLSDDYLTSKQVSLSVKTTQPNERVNIALMGQGGRFTGCSGPIVTNASISVPTPVTTTSSTTTSSTTTTSTTTTIAKAVASGPTTTLGPPTVACSTTKCDLGYKGPNGGVVFITPSTPGNSTGNYFEAIYGTFVYNIPFGCDGTNLPPTGSAIGDGVGNTARLLFSCGTSSAVSQAQKVYGRTVLDSSAWFLPSIGELEQLVNNSGLLGKVGEYWSSTASSATKIKVATAFRRPFRADDRAITQSFDVALVAQFTPKLGKVPVVNPARAYNIGDAGPAGGKVFITPSTPGNKTGKYFEVAPTDWSGTEIKLGANKPQVAWSCNQYHSTTLPGTKTEIGTGFNNTQKINGACAGATNTADWAAAKATAYRGGNRTDWFVPSRDELIQIYQHIDDVTPALINRGATYSYQIACMWSSSEINATVAWGGNGLLPPWGSEMNATKKEISTNCVVPVRMFDASEPFGTKAN